jgi:AraC family transcriptional regulator
MGTTENLDVVDQDRRLIGATASDAVHPFRVNFSDAERTAMRRRTSGTRWPDRATVTDQSQSPQPAKLQKLERYWETEYDWRKKVEANLNAHNSLDAPLRTGGAIAVGATVAASAGLATTAVADTVRRLLSDAGKAMSTDLDAAGICLAQASVLLQAERRRQSQQSASRVGVSLARGGLAPWQIRRVIAYIDSHLDERIKVPDFHELTRLSGSHFSRAFRISFGDSPHNFVIRRRIECAQKLMLETSASLCEIALRCGLCDQAHLSRLFRQAVGMSPNAWRRHQQIEGQSDRARESEAARFSDRIFGVARSDSHESIGVRIWTNP